MNFSMLNEICSNYTSIYNYTKKHYPRCVHACVCVGVGGGVGGGG